MRSGREHRVRPGNARPQCNGHARRQRKADDRAVPEPRVATDAHSREEGSGSIAVRRVLDWARTDEGYETVKKDHFGAADYLRRMAEDLLA